jgi:hypothetical protein
MRVWSRKEFAAASADPAFGDCVHAGRPDVAEHGPDAGVGEDRVERGGEVRAVVADHELGPIGLFAGVHEEVASLLGGPLSGGMQGDSEDADPPGRVLDHGQDMGLGAAGQVGREEVACQDRLGLRMQELRPGRTCGAENLCHQVIFVEDAASAVTPLDPEMVQVAGASGPEHRVERGGEAGVPVMQHELHPRPGVLQVHEQVPCLLHHPGLDRMLGGAQNPYAAGAVLDHGKDIDPGSVEQVGGEEVQRQDARCLGSQKLRPARAVPARGAGPVPARLRICHTVGGATVTPSPASSPWIRR